MALPRPRIGTRGGNRVRPAPGSPWVAPLVAVLLAAASSAGAQGDSTGFSESPLPILVVGLPAEDVPDESKASTVLRVVYNGPGVTNTLDGPTRDYVGGVAIERRGSSSQAFPKTGYKLELRGADGRDTSAALLRMPREEDWVLHGPYSDKTLIRNAFTYAMARGLSQYAPRARLVEVVMGGDYRGVYLLVESVKRDGDRVDVAKLTPGDLTGDALTGGYILKVDKLTGDELSLRPFFDLPARGLRGRPRTRLIHHYPKPGDIAEAQRDYITAWMTAFEERLAADDFEDPVRGYRPLVDLRSFIDYLFVNEVTRDVDAYRLSTYLYKERDRDGGRLHMGPVWDFNIALANANYGGGDAEEGWAFDFDLVHEGPAQVPFWFPRLWSSNSFRKDAAARWWRLRADGAALSDGRLFGIFDSLAAEVGGAVAERNFERWPVLGEYTWPNAFVPDSHAGALSHARAFLAARLAWLDERFDAANAAGTPVADGRHARRAPRVTPNPAPPSSHVEVAAGVQGFVDYEWYDVAGRVVPVTRTAPRGENLLRTPAAPGVYFYRLRYGDGRAATGRCVVGG